MAEKLGHGLGFCSVEIQIPVPFGESRYVVHKAPNSKLYFYSFCSRTQTIFYNFS